jgi:putative ABC transport system permease protein
VRDATLGFDKDHVVAIPVQDITLRRDYQTLRDAWLRDAAVRVVGATGSAYPGRAHSGGHVVKREEASDGETETMLRNWIDDAYLETLSIDIAAGRGFSSEFASDSAGAILNEAAVRALGWTSADEALGQTVILYPDASSETRSIIGVVDDFHFNSLHHQIAPLILTPHTSPTNLLVRIEAQNISNTLAGLQTTWETFSDQPFTYTFLDDQIDALYRADVEWGRALGAASLLAVFIACLGLFGLAAFAAEQRTKEFGIRKVLGASVPGLVALLSRDFLTLVALAFVIAVPVAYVVMNRWLEEFAYRTEVGWGLFLLAGLIALLIALLTVSYQSIRAALADPVKSLRYE